MAYVVLGAGGPTGVECVKRLLEATTAPVRAVVRDPSKHAGKFDGGAADNGGRLTVVAGDVTDPASLKAALDGAKGCIFAASGGTYWSAKPVDYQGVVNAAEATKAAAAPGARVVLVSSMLTDPANGWHPVRCLLNTIRWRLMDQKFASERALAASGVPYAVVKPGGLTSGARGQAAISADRDVAKEVGMGSIARGDVAAVCVEALTNPAAAGHKFSVYCPKGGAAGAPAAAGPPADYEAHIKGLFGGAP